MNNLMIVVKFGVLLTGTICFTPLNASPPKRDFISPSMEQQLDVEVNNNNTAFTRSVAADFKRKKAAVHFQNFRNSGDDESLEKALKYLGETIALAPESKSTWQLSALINYELRDVFEFQIEAIHSFEKLLSFEPTDTVTRVLLIDELMKLGAWQRAVEHLEELFVISPQFSIDTTLDRMVVAYLQTGWFERGADFLAKQIPQSKKPEPLLIALAVMQQTSGDTAEASLSLGKVLLSNSANGAVREQARALKEFWAQNPQSTTEEDAP